MDPTVLAPDLIRAVLSLSRYLQDHPRACDSAPGISLWWFPVDDAPSEIDVLRALDWMVVQGFMNRCVGGDDRVSYARADADADLVARVVRALDDGAVRH